jgi:DNA primase
MPLQNYHKQYLLNRRFDPDKLVEKYGIMGTGPAGDYSWRIIAPIMLDGQMVSYQGRSILQGGREPIKYRACQPGDELINHKTILYNIDNAGDIGIVVEGTFDVWRFGDGAVAAIGTTVTRTQINMAARRFKRVFIVFDAESAAQKKAKKMANELAALGVESAVVSLNNGDPADLPQDEADNIKAELLK